MQIVTFFLSLLFLFSFSYQASAFKIDTHVWVGQQVINDLEEDRQLTFQLGNRAVDISIDPAITDAILANKTAFLMGNIGPDASPDVIVGQMVVHPGVEDAEFNNIGWRTNKWLEHLWQASQGNPVGTAYTYGYLGHAAADVFAHTYVNQYAGNIFRLTDEETVVEQRHFVLESFIGKLTPALQNFQGQNLGNPWDVVNLNDDDLANFIRDHLIYNEEVQAEYSKVAATIHLTSYYAYRNAINDLANDDIWNEIDVFVTQYLVSEFTGGNITLSDEEAESLAGAMQDLESDINGDVDSLQEYGNELYQFLAEYEDKAFAELMRARERMRSAQDDWLAGHRRWRERLLDVRNLPSCPKIYKCRPTWTGPKCSWKSDRVCERERDNIRAINNQILSDAETLENEALELRDEFEQTLFDLRAETLATVDATNTLKNAIIDGVQFVSRPIQGMLFDWRDDVDRALSEYVKATAQSMINTIDLVDGNELDPIQEWFGCYHYSIIGIPYSVSNCEVQDAMTQLSESMSNTFAILDSAATLGIDIPNLTELEQLRDEYIQSIQDEFIAQVAEELIELLPQEIQDFLKVVDLNVDDQILNQYFTVRQGSFTPPWVLNIPDMSTRVRAEMNITDEGTFDPERYSPAYNAVVMAKLALLSNYDFEQLANAAGASDYAQNYLELDNLVAQAFANIDGNHQWMPIPPPLAKAEGQPYDYDINYTYSTDRSQLTGDERDEEGLGFLPWKGDMRDKLFRKLFKGPLSPGVDAPELINASNLVGSDYKYNPCSFHPFPDDVNDQLCTIVPLIPVLSILY